jgi:hypothetical protein
MQFLTCWREHNSAPLMHYQFNAKIELQILQMPGDYGMADS